MPAFRFATYLLLLASLYTVFFPISLLAQRVEKTAITIAIMQLAPYGFQDNLEQTLGSHYEIAHQILHKSKLVGQVVLLPLKRLNPESTASVAIDCALVGDVPFVRKHFQLIEPLGIELIFGVLPRLDVSLHAYQDLKGLNIGYPLGGGLGEPFDSDQSFSKTSTINYQAAVGMLAKMRLDAVAGVINSIEFGATSNGINKAIFGPPLILSRVQLWLVCRNDAITETTKRQLKLSIQQLIREKAITDIDSRY